MTTVIKPNDLKKGDVVLMRGTGWRATIADNAKGTIRMATVEGVETETGSVYVWDIGRVLEYQGKPVALGEVRIELPESYEKQRKTIQEMGF